MSYVGRVQGLAVNAVAAAAVQRPQVATPASPAPARPLPPAAPQTGPLSRDKVQLDHNGKQIPQNISLFGTGDLAPVVDHVLGPKTAKPEAPKAPQKPGFLKLFG